MIAAPPAAPHRPSPIWPRDRCPVLVVVGDNDFVLPADRLVAALPDATLPHPATHRPLRHAGVVRFIDAALGFLDAVPD